MRKFGLIFFGFFILLPSTALAAGVMINEIAWMGTIDSASNEWIELYNTSSGPVSLEGWQLLAQDGTPNVLLSGTIAGGGYFLLERTDDNTVPSVPADQIYTGALSNSGEVLVLKDASGTEVDRVDGSNNWAIGGNNEPKETLQRSSGGWITAAPTPRAANAGASPPPPPPASSSGPQTQSQTPSPSMSAYAGEDRTATAGAPVEFIANATGFSGEPITSARFLWNFGDGESAESRAVAHVFRIPGKYTVGLHISSGEHGASDYLTVTVIPNQIIVSGVLLGSEGYFRLENPAGVSVEIGEWVARDATGKEFPIPAKTRIGARSEIAFANALTGLLASESSLPFTLSYPNRTVALRSSGGTGTPSAATAREKRPTRVAELMEGSEIAPLATTTVGEIAAAARPFSASPQFFFWIAFALSIAASAGFLFVKKFL